MTAYSPGNPFAQTKADPAPEADTDAVENSSTPEQLRHRASMLANELLGRYRESDTLDDAVETMKAMKGAYDALYAAFGEARTDMWENYGAGKHATESGRTFSFTAPSGSRSCNYADLEAKYPDAYDECVTKKAPKADAVGALRLPKGDLK